MRLAPFLLPCLLACGPSGRARFVGNERPSIASPEAVEVHSAAEVPTGFTVLGVVTATCETYDDASGLLERPCSEEGLLLDARAKASEVGGMLLVEPHCENQVIERSLEQVKNGGAKGHTRRRLQCRASVALAESTDPRQPVLARKTQASPTHGRAHITVGGMSLTVWRIAWSGQAARAPRTTDDVTELERTPSGSVPLGQVWSECESSCSSAVARRGLKHAAAEAGAFALAEASCEPLGDRWRCNGTAVGEKLTASDPPP